MKHNLAVTLELLFWTAIALMFGFIVTPHILSQKTQPLPVSPLTFVLIVMGILLLAAYVWIKLFKVLKPDTLVGVFSGGIGAMLHRATTSLLPFPSFGDFIDVVLMLLIIYLYAFAFYYFVKYMQKSWKNTQKVYGVANLIMVIVIPVVAAIMSKGVPVWAAMLLLFLVACYDAYAVWKSKHMITLAKTFMRLRILPGIIVPRKEREHFAILGGGDVFFISFVSASAFGISPMAAVAVLIGGFGAIVGLFIASKKKKYYPAIPFIFVGVAIGLSWAWLLS